MVCDVLEGNSGRREIFAEMCTCSSAASLSWSFWHTRRAFAEPSAEPRVLADSRPPTDERRRLPERPPGSPGVEKTGLCVDVPSTHAKRCSNARRPLRADTWHGWSCDQLYLHALEKTRRTSAANARWSSAYAFDSSFERMVEKSIGVVTTSR